MNLLQDLNEARREIRPKDVVRNSWLAILLWGTEIGGLLILVVVKGWSFHEAKTLLEQARWLVEVRYFKAQEEP
jgi:hypothetical protein